MIAILLYVLLFTAMLPGALVFVREDDGRAPLVLALALALWLTAGGLSLAMLAAGLAALPVTAVTGAVGALGLALPGVLAFMRMRPRLALPDWNVRRGLACALVLGVCVTVLFNALYWPFHRDDAIAIYQPQAAAVFETGALPVLPGRDTLYRAYPMLVPLHSAFVYSAAGWQDEGLANGLNTLLALTALVGAWHFAAAFAGVRAGWAAALLLVSAPVLGRWASSGYTDLPMAAAVTLGAVFLLRLWQAGRVRDALASGLCFGLAAWTKNNALVFAVVATGWMVWCALHRRASWRTAALGGLALLLIAGPWYVRVLLTTGFVMPPTAWTDQAQRTLQSALVLLTGVGSFGAAGWATMLGGAYAAAQVVRARAQSAAALLGLALVVPFFVVWWALASYDPRFLLGILPLGCALGGAALAALLERLPAHRRVPAAWAGLAVAAMLAGYVAFVSVEFKREIIARPLMSIAEKRELLGGESLIRPLSP